jgi:2-polyprenyl-3-methyl-5-hydroxy-6-metoxy-1,4-benzoquinol methylase
VLARYARPMNRSECPCRAGAKAQPLFAATDSVSGEQFEVVRCTACALARTDPQPSSDELDRYYPSGYHRATKRYRLGLDRGLWLLHRARIRRIERLTGGPGQVLDVGCGPGRFLDHMRRRGWETRGTERSADAARQARDVLGLDVRAQELEEVVAEGISYDAVVLWHVAEHVHDPATTLRHIARLLRPGGVLLVAVPNFGSPEAKIGKAGWFHLDVPRHLFHFTPVTLMNLLSDAGLELREGVHIAPEYDIFSFLQTVQNCVGLPPNLLYDVLRRRESRLAHLRVRSLLSVLAMASAVPLTLVGLVWAPLAAALGGSATITVYAQRPPGVASD